MASTLVRKVLLKLSADDGDTEEKLDKISAKADELARKHPDIKVKVDSAAAFAKLMVLRKAMKDTDDQSASLKGRFAALGQALNTGLLGGISTNIGEMTMFGKVMAGLNLATGLAEPLMAGLIVSTMGLAAGLASAGLGLGVFGLAATSAFSQVTAANTAGVKLKGGLGELQRQLKTATGEWDQFGKAASPGVARVMAGALKLIPDALKLAQPFLAPTERALGNITGMLGKAMSSAGAKSWFGSFAQSSGSDLTKVAVAIGHIASGLGGLLKAFLPVSGSMLSGLDKITGKFATWGQTLTGHSGFQSLMAMFKSDTPVVVGLLKNLAGIIGTVVGQMTGMNTVSNSRTLIQVAEALSGLVNNLLKAHPQLVTYILYAKLATDTSKQLFGGIKSVSDAVGTLKTGGKAISDFSAGFGDAKKAADEATGAAGTYGGQLAKVAQKLGLMKAATVEATAATEGEEAAQVELDGAMDANPIGLIIIAIAALAIGFAELWKHSAAFRDFWKAAWKDISAAASAAWRFLDNDALKPLMAGIDKTLAFVKSHWKLLSAIILGPIGLIIDALATHWSAVEHGFEAAYKFVAAIVSTEINFVRNDVIGPYVKWSEAVFRAGWDAVKAVFQAAWGFLRPFVAMEVNAVKLELSWFEKLAGLFLGWWDDAAHAVSVGIGKLVGFVLRLPGMVNSALGGLPGMMFNAGIHVIENLIDGIMSQVGHLGSVMGGIASKVAGFFGLSPAKEGPLSAGGAPFIRGQHFALDIAAGMKASLPAVSASSAHVAAAAGIGAPGRAAGYGAAGGAAQPQKIQFQITGGSREFRTWFKKNMRITGGDVSVVGS